VTVNYQQADGYREPDHSGRLWLDRSTILLAPVGSKLYGTAISQSDDDQMGVCIEPLSEAFGLHGEFEQDILQTPEMDRTVYGLRKFCRLALKGNPTVLELLYVPTDRLLRFNALGGQLRELAPEFLSKRAGNAFLGYMQQQLQRLKGERGQMDVNRQKLKEQFGFDTKYAAHIIRLGYEGVEYLTYGRLTLPLPALQQDRCKAVRRGEVSLNDALTEAGQLEREIKDLLSSSPLPDQPNSPRVEQWMLDRYFEWWKCTQQEWVAYAGIEKPKNRDRH
jgi:hypothetical protein